MKIEEIVQLLDAEVVYIPEDYDRDIEYASASDLMSDVLAHTSKVKMLLTGLNTPQAIRTASILDLPAVVIVRGKTPNGDVIGLAKELNIPLLTTKKSLFCSSAILYNAGLKGIEDESAIIRE